MKDVQKVDEIDEREIMNGRSVKLMVDELAYLSLIEKIALLKTIRIEISAPSN